MSGVEYRKFNFAKSSRQPAKGIKIRSSLSQEVLLKAPGGAGRLNDWAAASYLTVIENLFDWLSRPEVYAFGLKVGGA